MSRKQLIAANLLLILVLAISWSPRIRLEASRVIDIRVQDLMMPALLVSAWMLGGFRWRRPLPAIFPVLLSLLLLLSFLSFMYGTWFNYDVSLLRRFGFYGRFLEVVLLVFVTAGLAVAANQRAVRSFRAAVFVGFVGNLLWASHQMLTGVYTSLLDPGVADAIESYGPNLVGEPSPFGAGIYFAFICGFFLAEYEAGLRSGLRSSAFFALSAVGAFWSQSRISLAAILVLAVLGIMIPRHRGAFYYWRLAACGSVAALGATLIRHVSTDRLTADGVHSSLETRTGEIWVHLLDPVGHSPLLGVGPGALGTDAIPETEAHNLLLRAVLDFGMPAAFVLVVLLGMLAFYSIRTIRSAPMGADDLRFAAWLMLATLICVYTAGLVQDSLTPVMSTHLLAVSIGIFLAARGLARPHR